MQRGIKRITGGKIKLRNENELQRTETEWMRLINKKWVADVERRYNIMQKQFGHEAVK